MAKEWAMYLICQIYQQPMAKGVDIIPKNQKELISRFVLASTNEGDTVADYYLGSGTTALFVKN